MVTRKRKDSPFYTVYKKGGNVEKKLPAKDAKSIAVDIEKIEFDIRKDITDQIIDDFKKNQKPGETLKDYLDRQPDSYFKRISAKNGGVIDLAKYRKSKEPKVKKLNLAQGDFDKAVADVQSESDRDLIKRLLRMSGINVGSD
tara:strand:- start:594 stop:1022 length:429 start_codon:yes stop_codon:yes gene_type:complete